MKVIHITDTHFVGRGQKLFGLNPRLRLDAAVNDINRFHADAEIAVITGDLAHWGERDAYENLKECLAALSVPVVPLIGNHDDRATFCAVFQDAQRDADGFVQGVAEFGRNSLIFLDTNQPDTHAGWYCDKRLAWLEAHLQAIEAPIFMFMHHPPFRTGLRPLDRIGLTQAAAFQEVVESHAHKIGHLFYGHVHRPICGSWLGIPTSTIRGTNHQVYFDLSGKDTAIPFSYEEAAYAVALIDRDTVNVHTHEYLYNKGIYRSGAYDSVEEEKAFALNFAPAAAE